MYISPLRFLYFNSGNEWVVLNKGSFIFIMVSFHIYFWEGRVTIHNKLLHPPLPFKIFFFSKLWFSYFLLKFGLKCNWTKCLKNQPCDVTKMRDYQSLFKGYSFPLLLSSLIIWRHITAFFGTLCKASSITQLNFV